MSKQELQIKAEQFVRRVLGTTFGQKIDRETVANAAAKIVRAVPTASPRAYSTKPHGSSSQRP